VLWEKEGLNMARTPLIPLNGTEEQRQAALRFIDPDELNATTDQHRFFVGDYLISPIWHGTVTMDEMLNLFNTEEQGCFPGDMCWCSDNNTLYRCIARVGLDIADWFALLTLATDVSLGGGSPSDSKVPSQKAVKAYCDALLAASEAMIFKGVINCSGNPNYPAASIGWVYKVSVAGKIGGASGIAVEVGDTLICIIANSGGDQATVGADWVCLQTNIDGAVIGPASSVDSRIALFNGTTGRLVKDSGVLLAALVATGLITGSGLTMNSNRMLGRSTAAAGAIEEIQVGTNLSLSGGILSAAGASATLDARDIWLFE
jgi:hypothetical protein